jgi:hypothetical protein
MTNRTEAKGDSAKKVLNINWMHGYKLGLPPHNYCKHVKIAPSNPQPDIDNYTRADASI